MQGGTAAKGSEHNQVHKELEKFWDQYRKNGSKEGQMPTNKEYDSALKAALETAGKSKADAKTLADAAKKQRQQYGHRQSDPVPNLPNPIPPQFLP